MTRARPKKFAFFGKGLLGKNNRKPLTGKAKEVPGVEQSCPVIAFYLRYYADNSFGDLITDCLIGFDCIPFSTDPNKLISYYPLW